MSFTTIDANDPDRLSAFWGAGARFQRVPETKSVKNRVHLDIRVDDLQEATDAVLALGGSWDGSEFDIFVSDG